MVRGAHPTIGTPYVQLSSLLCARRFLFLHRGDGTAGRDSGVGWVAEYRNSTFPRGWPDEMADDLTADGFSCRWRVSADVVLGGLRRPNLRLFAALFDRSPSQETDDLMRSSS
jgi:hypothetical protein